MNKSQLKEMIRKEVQSHLNEQEGGASTEDMQRVELADMQRVELAIQSFEGGLRKLDKILSKAKGTTDAYNTEAYTSFVSEVEDAYKSVKDAVYKLSEAEKNY